MAQLKAERSAEAVISPMRKSESVGVSTQLPQLCGTLQKGLISLLAHPECQETVLRGNFIVINAYIKTTERLQINNLSQGTTKRGTN